LRRFRWDALALNNFFFAKALVSYCLWILLIICHYLALRLLMRSFIFESLSDFTHLLFCVDFHIFLIFDFLLYFAVFKFNLLQSHLLAFVCFFDSFALFNFQISKFTYFCKELVNLILFLLIDFLFLRFLLFILI